MNELVIPPKSAVALSALNAPMLAIAPAMDISRDCKREWFEHIKGLTQSPRCVPAAIDMRDFMFGDFLKVDDAYCLLSEALEAPLDQQVAIDMLTVLYQSLATKRGDNIGGLIAGCIQIFESDELGQLSGLWKPIRATPAVLALAASKLMNTEKWGPKPSEVGEACREAREAINEQRKWMLNWLEAIRMADGVLLEFAHDEWERPYLEDEMKRGRERMLEWHHLQSYMNKEYIYKKDSPFYKLVECERAKLLPPHLLGLRRRQRLSKPKSLFQFITSRGGLKPCPDLKYILDGKHGRIVSKSGMSLDTAREACIEEGFLQDHECREQEPTINDLLELIAAEARGNKQYRIHEAVDAHKNS